MIRLPFIKMQGIGNDFVVIDRFGSTVGARSGSSFAEIERLTPAQARRICDRRFGIGADQILWLKRPVDTVHADVRMEIINQDGSAAEMCGNGIRAVGLYLTREKLVSGKTIRVETLAGVKTIEVTDPHVRVDMGPPVLGAGVGPGADPGASGGKGEILRLPGVASVAGPSGVSDSQRASGPAALLLPADREVRFFEVGMGNPHAVIFVESLAAHLSPDPMADLGPLIEVHPRFAKRTNVEFALIEDPSTLRLRVWERGAGFTLACGTGACAAAVAALQTGRVRGTVKVRLPGGELLIDWAGPGHSVFMAGVAEESFRGEIEI